METFFGVPAHPISIHFPAVAIPALTAIVIALVVRPRWRSQFGLAVTAFAVVTTISTFLAAASGEALADLLEAGDYIDTHRSLGLTLRWFVLGMSVAIAALVLLGRGGERSRMPSAVTSGISAAAVIFAVLAGIWVIRTGHEGATQHWCQGTLCEDSEDDASASAAASTTSSTTGAPSTTAATTIDAATTAAPATTAASTTTIASGEITTDAPNGALIYEARCQTCHGDDGRGIRGPTLQGIADKQPDPAAAIEQINGGGGGMPAFADRLTPDEILAVVIHIRTAFSTPGA
ncbi:MAG: c-type cytochrome [Acidimicrobiales bacterium]